MRYRSKVILALLTLTLLSNGVLLWLSYQGASALLFQQIQSKVLSIAKTAALMVPAAEHEKLQQPADQQSADYTKLELTLRDVRNANRRDDIFAKFVYTMRPDPARPGHWLYVVDAEEPGAEKSALGDPVDYKSEDEGGFSLLSARAETAFSYDKFGVWLSANAPIVDAQGKGVAVLGVDLAADGVIEEQSQLLHSGLLALSVSLVVALLCSLVLSRWVSAPLARLRGTVEQIAKGDLAARVPVTSRDEFGEVGVSINSMAVSLRERETLKGALARYVSHHVAETIVADNRLPDLKGERRRITVLFCDIRNFTQFANGLPPEDVFAFLNEFFAEMIDVIFRHRGTLDKLLGDGLMALFGAPLDDPEHERNAVRAALEMQQRLTRLREEWRDESRAEIAIGIGLHSGEAVVGNVGSEKRMDYTAIGDTVNVASRLEAATKEFKCSILLSDSTAAALGDEFDLKRLGDIHARGVSQSVTVYSAASREIAGEK